MDRPSPHRVAGLFAGIGGLELGLHRSGHETVMLCEIEPGAQAVLTSRFPGVPVVPDVTALKSLPPDTTLLTAGFPCQDLSQAGKTAGISGQQSGLVNHIFRLLRRRRVPWLLLENVSFMLRLAKGEALTHVLDELDALGYVWAYRVIDSRAFGVPQRRQRVYLLACLPSEGDPRDVLLSLDAGAPIAQAFQGKANGFYWTEGTRGLGWAVDAIPTLKGGSTIGIASPPAIWMPDGSIVTPEIRDGERLQGFPANWTKPALEVTRAGMRWKLVGNAVTVDAAKWIGERMLAPSMYDPSTDVPLEARTPWPNSAWSMGGGERFRATVSEWPVRRNAPALAEFLKYPTSPLSERAAAGFLKRATASSLRFPEGFLDAIETHLQAIRREPSAA
jgi:DNA (cytosine-5)-methyltransferase 1